MVNSTVKIARLLFSLNLSLFVASITTELFLLFFVTALNCLNWLSESEVFDPCAAHLALPLLLLLLHLTPLVVMGMMGWSAAGSVLKILTSHVY